MEAELRDLIDCRICNGTGWRNKPTDDICLFCDGMGKTWVKAPFVECNLCDGTGFRNKPTHDLCQLCDGAGVVTIDKYRCR